MTYLTYHFNCPTCGAELKTETVREFNWYGTPGPWVVAYCSDCGREVAELEGSAEHRGGPKMTDIVINGISTEAPAGAVAYKHADPMEDARWLYDVDEAAGIAREDDGLIVWVPSNPAANPHT